MEPFIFDPPYYLSNGGISVQSGKQVCVDKGDWDKGGTPEHIYNFNRNWLELCRPKLKDNGTIWISGTYHNIFVVQRCLQECGYKILNIITWQKTDPPPNLSCRYFNFSTELIIWARKSPKIPHKFNYDVMKELNGGKQMTDVWRLPAVGKWEKTCGKHPTQKPLLYRIILASTDKGGTILDPFAGSSTTGIAANLLERNFIGIEKEQVFVELSNRRFNELQDNAKRQKLLENIKKNDSIATVLVNHARKELRELMIEKGICYLRAGDSKGSLQVTSGFERMKYVLLHTNGENCQLFRLKKEGTFQIWTKENLEKYGFSPEHSPYYTVLHFDNKPMEFSKTPSGLKQRMNTYKARLYTFTDFL
ncbi:MAG: site-specific DNA-methyltransferase [Alphaproteobacteria bacterium]|nr:site-specific DNA-methyltransferase [Alphaproteobacteria bacterium]